MSDFKSFVGVNPHNCTVTLAAVDPAGELFATLKISTKCVDKIEGWLLVLPRPSRMAVEACPFVEWFIDRFREHVDGIDIADATELSNRRGKWRKNDRNDALDIARRPARCECPLGLIADPQLMQHLLGRAPHQAFADCLDVVLLTERHRVRLRREIVWVTRSEAFLDTQLILQSVPGIGDIWGLIIAAEIGPFERFPNADALEFWAGLRADLKESAGRTQSGNITQAGSAVLRWALCQAAMSLCRCDAWQEVFRQRFIARPGNAKANVGMGRRLLRTLYAMVRDKKSYRCGQPIDRTARMNQARARKRKFQEAA